MHINEIKQNVRKILREFPEGVQLVAAVKTRSVQQILEAINAGVQAIGENYVQEAERTIKSIAQKLGGSFTTYEQMLETGKGAVEWHFIGHLQKNKVKKAIKIFDLIQTIDSEDLAREVDRVSAQENKIMPILLEINSAQEQQKFGIMAEEAPELVKRLAGLKNIRIMGLMTMGPLLANAQLSRPYFTKTKQLFDRIGALDLANVQMKYLSMGMTNSYQAAIAEGANIIRIGTKIFGERE